MPAMPTRYAQLPTGPDHNTPRLDDSALTQLAAGHPEAVNARPYTSPITRWAQRQHASDNGGTR